MPADKSVPPAVQQDVERRVLPRRVQREELASPTAQAFYRRVMEILWRGGVDFLVGGAYAFARYTGIDRCTKDLDLFVAPEESAHAFEVLSASGLRTDVTFPHWLGKVFQGHHFADLIFNSGNGVTPVDDLWFTHATRGTVLGLPTRLVPAEEMLWSKAFVMERERYDGADVMHILRSRAERLDWDRLLARFGARWRVLLSHLILFGFVYPGERSRIPDTVMTTLLDRARSDLGSDADVGRLCQGTVTSREQYLPDTLEWGYTDGRLAPTGSMTADQIAAWTAAIDTMK